MRSATATSTSAETAAKRTDKSGPSFAASSRTSSGNLQQLIHFLAASSNLNSMAEHVARGFICSDCSPAAAVFALPRSSSPGIHHAAAAEAAAAANRLCQFADPSSSSRRLARSALTLRQPSNWHQTRASRHFRWLCSLFGQRRALGSSLAGGRIVFSPRLARVSHNFGGQMRPTNRPTGQLIHFCEQPKRRSAFEIH